MSPLYEFKCLECGYEYEDIRPVEKRDKEKCSKCKSKAYRKISKNDFKLKGKGWARDGYNKN